MCPMVSAHLIMSRCGSGRGSSGSFLRLRGGTATIDGPMRRMTGQGPRLHWRVRECGGVMRCWGVEALETAVQGVAGTIPEAMRSAARVSKSRPGI